MAPQLPASLRAADIGRFAQRAAQLETAKPAIAYWCEYWIVNQLLARGLHNTDAESLQYTTGLMDKLEQTKIKYASDDAIVDDTAGQAYVEQFGLETFERADRAVQADKVTKQTADTFLAASTFLELLNIWGEPDKEIQAKIRYAKWNAVRIVKALKDGKDPNESNPKPEPQSEELLQPLDPNDPEVRELTGLPARNRQASVEEVPDEQDRLQSHLARQSILDRSLHPSAQPSARASPGPKEADQYYDASKDNDVSPMEPSPNERGGSVGGGYFPEVPTFTSDSHGPNPPTFPVDEASSLGLPDPSRLPPPGETPPPNFSFMPPSAPRASSPPQHPQNSFRPPPQSPPPAPPAAPQTFYRPAPPPQPFIPPVVPMPAPVPAPLRAQPSRPQAYITDDAAIAKAQKHAKWAISALNFEDVPTAVKELRAALETLGAQ